MKTIECATYNVEEENEFMSLFDQLFNKPVVRYKNKSKVVELLIQILYSECLNRKSIWYCLRKPKYTW